jgi:hypothetical protein
VQPFKLDYEPVRAAIARGDMAAVEVHARKLRDKHFAELVRRTANTARSYIRNLLGQEGTARLDLPST